jgi:hypothetical protein
MTIHSSKGDIQRDTANMNHVSFLRADALDLASVIDAELEETRLFLTQAKGKGREGSETDADLALQLYIRDLEAQHIAICDRNMAQSLASAIL